MKKLIMLLIYSSVGHAGVTLPEGGWHYLYNVDLGEKTQFALSYHSRSTQRTELGMGWCGPWSGKVEKIDFEKYRVSICGKQIYFNQSEAAQGLERIWKVPFDYELKIQESGFRLFAPGQKIYEFNKLGRLVEIREQGDWQRVQYDALGRVKAYSQANSVLIFEYDSLESQVRQIRRSSSLSGIRLSFADGNLKEIKFHSRWARFRYDEFDNLEQIDRSDMPTQRIKYDDINDRVIRVEQNKCVQKINYKTNKKAQVLELKKSSACIGLEPVSNTFQFVYSNRQSLVGVRVLKTSPNSTEQEYYSFEDPAERKLSNLGDEN